ncbi:hypothetical protein DFJ73DRAFT_814512 [Zopfochytrium polystomum]|nr:hypothetical protein DFJ73DRAFT_814512 [Zopfochytrium polystomum]
MAAAAVVLPEFVQAAPFAVDLEPGKTYYWCACGKSKSQPFCDGSHKGSSFSPKAFTVEEAKKYFLCGCKITETGPFCDGTHRKEKGLKRYNELLLKKNSELLVQIAEAKKAEKTTRAVAVAASVAAAAVAVVLARVYGK